MNKNYFLYNTINTVYEQKSTYSSLTLSKGNVINIPQGCQIFKGVPQLVFKNSGFLSTTTTPSQTVQKLNPEKVFVQEKGKFSFYQL